MKLLLHLIMRHDLHRLFRRPLPGMVGVFLIVACQEPPQPTTLATYPHAMERMARLERSVFTASDPAQIEQQIFCESHRVERVIGSDFDVRVKLLDDSIRSEFTPAQFNHVAAKLSLKMIESGDSPICGPINADAQLEVPLPIGKRGRVTADSGRRVVPGSSAPAAPHP